MRRAGIGAGLVVVLTACGGSGTNTHRRTSTTTGSVTTTTGSATSTSGVPVSSALDLACEFAPQILDDARAAHGRGFEADVERYLVQIDDAVHQAQNEHDPAEAKIVAFQSAAFALEDADRPHGGDVQAALQRLAAATRALGCPPG